ncbi:MAG TPA: nucleoside-diphosphate sugar epimerase/dehydratase [Polyangiales bacterium]|nr:nucleoside-diphosphate sugar epimerase/dehydratase [Polyangiales bacterium]
MNSHLRRILIISVHVALWTMALLIAVVLRFETVPEFLYPVLPPALALLVVLRIGAFFMHGLFHGLWRYAGLPELRNLIRATTTSTIVFVGAGTMFTGVRLPRSVYVGEWLVAILLMGGIRFAIRMVRERRQPLNPLAVRTLIVGAGDQGESLLRDVQRAGDGKWEVVGFLDDDRTKQGALVREVRVLGPADEATLRRVVEQRGVRLVVLAIPRVAGGRIRQILAVCRLLGVQTKTVPSIGHRMIGVEFAEIREVSIEDLLRRDPVQLDLAQVASFVANRTLLVTGAGGSIGSELVRQALWFKPKRLVLYDRAENSLFYIERELASSATNTEIVIAVGDISDRARLEQVLRRHRPNVVLHTAAYKHVPTMEHNVSEAVKNNVFGTLTVADVSHATGVEAFVMISTDKAVNPTSVMGASKRVAEMVIHSRNAHSEMRHVAVRFGNVLGSAGSVVPLFREQIARGGPVTVTHPDMRRYFMTIPEAAQLVLQAAALATGGELFVLDMGEPVKIVDLARDLIELSGLRPDVDIQIQFSGLRPGEKLFEELLLRGEAYDKTPHAKIMVGHIQSPPIDALKSALVALQNAAEAGDDARVRRCLAALVPEAQLSGVNDAEEATSGRLLEAPLLSST